MKILNLYAGIGGNRKLWGTEHEITAVEFDARIAEIYKDFYPNDTVIVEDAHQYLLEHYKEFDFIWSSPPCPSHSGCNYFLNGSGIIRYPDMGLYQEIIFLKTFFKGRYCVENVSPYYEPLIKPQKLGRHCFWTNFRLNRTILIRDSTIGRMGPVKSLGGKSSQGLNHEKLGFDLSNKKYPNKKKLLNNCVDPEIGKLILEQAFPKTLFS